jgi:UDP-glucose 4-epimerase
MRVLITGGAGFVGSHLADACLLRGDEVYVLDDLSTGSIDNIE